MSMREVKNMEIDIDEWRMSHPVNYIALMDVLEKVNGDLSMGEFIHRIIRMAIPDKLYKYYSLTNDEELNEIKLNTLNNKQIYLSETKSMNDPFEGKSFYYKREELMKFPELEKYEGRLIDDFSSHIKISSLSAAGANSMPMWAHYTNNHRGYCVEYDTNTVYNSLLKSILYPVQYTNQRIDITSIMVSFTEQILKQIKASVSSNKQEITTDNYILVWVDIFFNCIKQIKWSYEDEYRIVIANIPGKYSTISANPSKIFIGENCDPFYEEKIIRIGRFLNVEIFKMTFDEYSEGYELFQRKIQ